MSDVGRLEGFWKKEGPVYAERTIPANDPYRIKFIQDYVLKQKPKRVLEVGCNAGQNLITLHTLNHSVVCFGCDISDMKKHIPGFIYFKQASATDLPYGDDYFDVIFTHGLLEHIPPNKINGVVSELVRVSKVFVVIREDIEILNDGSYQGMSDAIFIHKYLYLFQNMGCDILLRDVGRFLGVKRLTCVFRKGV